jgi:allantoinase
MIVRFDLLIRGGSVVRPSGVEIADIAVSGGKIVEIAAGLSGSAAEEIDATGLHVFPGLIDVHVHFNDPGRADWEGAATGSAALAAGGGTCFFDMPLNSSPPVLDGDSFDKKVAALTGNSYADFALWGGLTPANLDKMEELADRGVVGFKAFMADSGIEDFTNVDDFTLLRGMERAAELGLPVAVHAENDNLTARLTTEARAAGKKSVRSYLSTRPVVAEVDAIRRAIAFARETGCDLHVVHVSSPAGAAELAGQRKNISGETCAHYLTLTDKDMEQIGAAAKCAPPLRAADDVTQLWASLENGQLQMVSSDHSPAPASMKTSDDFFAIWGGIAGVQSTRAVLLTREPQLSPERVAHLTAGCPSDRFRVLNKGQTQTGLDADFALIDLSRSFKLRREDLLDRHKLSPYVGRLFRGVVRRTILRGTTVFADGRIVGRPVGRFVRPGRQP